jgi:hypothetical protein
MSPGRRFLRREPSRDEASEARLRLFVEPPQPSIQLNRGQNHNLMPDSIFAWLLLAKCHISPLQRQPFTH